MADGIQGRLPAQTKWLPLPAHSESFYFAKGATLGFTASRLHGPDTPAGSVLLSGLSILLDSELVGKVAENGETELLGAFVFVR